MVENLLKKKKAETYSERCTYSLSLSVANYVSKYSCIYRCVWFSNMIIQSCSPESIIYIWGRRKSAFLLTDEIDTSYSFCWLSKFKCQCEGWTFRVLFPVYCDIFTITEWPIVFQNTAVCFIAGVNLPKTMIGHKYFDQYPSISFIAMLIWYFASNINVLWGLWECLNTCCRLRMIYFGFHVTWIFVAEFTHHPYTSVPHLMEEDAHFSTSLKVNRWLYHTLNRTQIIRTQCAKAL